MASNEPFTAGTDFPDSVKLEARRRAGFRCCYCRSRPGDDVHHIIPKEDGGQGNVDNAILLCAQCHRDYGDRRDKRLQLRQARDHWYEIVAQQIGGRSATQLEPGPVAVEPPVLDGDVEWHAPPRNETRPGYQQLWHAAFILGGRRKERARAYIDLDIGEGKPRRKQACIGDGTERIRHELTDIRPGQQYIVPAFTVIPETSKFWLDKRFVPDHPFWTEPESHTLVAGTYITDEPFLERVHRQPLVPGSYRVAVVLIIGDTEHAQLFATPWKELRAR